MAIYAIGDVQGCFDDLLKLLDLIAFDNTTDQLWFAGDLVNRGPKSLETLRFVKGLGDAAVIVLGNHDMHLLAASCSPKIANKKDALTPILEAPDCGELIDWLRFRPLFHYDQGFCMIHAGLPPQWDFNKTQKMAALAEGTLKSPDYAIFLKQMYGNKPNMWSANLKGMSRLRFIVNCFTRMRYCDAEGRLDFANSGPIGSQPRGLMPWFQVPGRQNADMRIICGHWSTLGYYEGDNCYAIDTGCLWGGQLTAIKLGEPVERFSIDCPGEKKPNKLRVMEKPTPTCANDAPLASAAVSAN
ncbi:MAG: symmetrical bis(5'-nucleosyl)-tetraphosphatase [Methylovulum sp.]|uniref:symmetrical bis(5'-nucleosyl)-tetraphosphatase n=1 Tax=Methylovulum sp. TaxID=1916980 RepID=UPI00261E918D|nr:symmetrical bis(5'-nucleosyl)-tetraphosphatase [Methylovulum sp.]MDD2724878.1 symmetrical bis(5'-nucleosyl)-tetraphosphatase [Methylovulum sp.]MDD5126296.1 symmetrical bis(5'-nucleosyl)-tetraphosphatase [Methylovulum sp.]